MKVMLVDDHPLFVDGLRNLLRAHGIEVLGTAHDGLEAVDKACALRPEVILMDIRMPKLNGVEAMRLIKNKLPDVKVVMQHHRAVTWPQHRRYPGAARIVV